MHKTVPVLTWTDVDEGIAPHVAWLNTIEGVRTYASCQGTIGEGGPSPYRAQIMASWPPGAEACILERFDIGERGDGWAYIYPIQPPYLNTNPT